MKSIDNDNTVIINGKSINFDNAEEKNIFEMIFNNYNAMYPTESKKLINSLIPCL